MLNFRRRLFACMLLMTCGSLAAQNPDRVAENEFTLARVIPSDVFTFENSRYNPERQFLKDYWNNIFQSVKQSGIDKDLAELFAVTLGLDKQHADEIERLKTKFSDLLAAVDWQHLQGAECAVAQRMMPVQQLHQGRPVIVSASVVWLARSNADETKANFESLVALLEAVVDEVNQVLGEQSLEVTMSSRMGAQLATLNLLSSLPQMPSLPLSVAIRDDILMISFREDLREDVLALLDGKSSATPLADSARFKSAFKELPPAEDAISFFDMQALLNPVRNSVAVVFDAVVDPNDVYRNTGMNAEASKINLQALTAYHSGNYAEALSLVKQAHEIEPNDSVVLYNLACFNALVGNQDDAVDWLEKAVEAGFYAPHKISTDADLKSLRDRPKYLKAVAAATELAGESSADDVALNCTNRGDVRRLRMQVQQAREKENGDQAMELIEQAFALAPHDSQVLYDLGCQHMLKGHQKSGLDFLQQAVEAGFYCPKQISIDPVWDAVRDNAEYQAAVAKAEQLASEVATNSRLAKSTLVKHLVERQADAAATLDYSACVEWTDSHAVRKETITVLVSDAPTRPIYPVFSQRQTQFDFARYLPEETTAFSVSGGVDPGQLYQFIEDTFRGGGPLGEELLSQWDQIQKKLGIDIKQDLFELIEGETINVKLGKGGGSVCMIKVSDEKKAREIVDRTMMALPRLLTEAISQQPALAALGTLAVRSSPLNHESLEGFQNVFVALSPNPVGVWGTADGFLIVASSADAVALCLATSHDQHPDIRQNPTLMSDLILPEGKFVSVSLADHRSSSKEAAAALSTGAMMGGMVAASIPKPELRPVVSKMTSMLGKLAPIVQKADLCKSVASTTTFDGQMWRARSITHYRSLTEDPPVEAHRDAAVED